MLQGGKKAAVPQVNLIEKYVLLLSSYLKTDLVTGSREKNVQIR